MLKISQMIVDHPEISELDINPLFADQNGILAVDARIRIAAAKQPADGRLAIKPYPAELEETVVLPSARRVLLRPVVPEDAAALTKLIDGLELRVAGQNLATHGALSSLRAPRSTQIDYDRQMVFVALNPVGPAIMKGVAGIDADPDNETARLTLAVGNTADDEELGAFLLKRMIGFSQQRGIGILSGDAARSNARLLTLGDKLGFTQSDVPGEPDVVRIILKQR
jgi:acetyltransferase